MQPTHLTYLEDFTVLENQAKVLQNFLENDRAVIVLDQTIFYPQGGGQPYDKGIIENASGKFIVEEVRFVDGIVKHMGHFEHGAFQEGEEVTCQVEKERRELHCRLHSAGHIVDMAVHALQLNWIPGKGYHFPDGPYVEYAGAIEESARETLKAEIEKLCNQFIEEGHKTETLFMPKERMHEVCHFVPDYIPEGKPARVVMYGDFGVPCGGTHVSQLSDVKKMTIRKIKPEKGNIRVGYDVER